MLYFIKRFALYLSLFFLFMVVAVGLGVAIHYINPMWVGAGLIVLVAAAMAYMDWRSRK